MIKQLLKTKVPSLIVMLATIMPLQSLAHNFEVDGIYYSIIDNGEVAVTYKGSSISSVAYQGSVSVPNSVTYQGKTYAVTSIGENAFWNCSNLTAVSLPATIKSIGPGAFYSCNKLTTISLAEGLETISKEAFKNCESLKLLTIPATVKYIGHLAFMSCYKLQEVIFLSTPDYLGANVFGSCYQLKRDDHDNLIFHEGKILCYLGASSHNVIPDEVEIIGGYAIGGNTKDLTIPDNVRFIGEGAINSAYLTKLTLGEGLKTIDGQLFSKVGSSYSSLAEITVKALTPPECLKGNPEGYYAFDLYVDTENCILYVDESALETYRNAPQWNKFTHIYPIPDPKFVIECSGAGHLYNKGTEVTDGATVAARDVNLLVLPDDRNRIEFITLNDTDITNQLENHTLSLSSFPDGGTLRIVFVPEKETTLTIKGYESHALTHYYNEGTKAKIEIIPEDGWKLYTLAFNGEDVTNKVVDNTYTTPALTGLNSIELVMKSDAITSVDQVVDVQRVVSFRKYGNIVKILDLEAGETISIYNADGTCEYQGENHTVTLPNNNVYILRTQNETLKFAF